MIDLLYHATIYYEIRKFVQESDRNALTYEMVIEKAKAHERNVLEYKDHQASHGEPTARLPTTIHCYLLTHCLKEGPVAAVIMANVVANVASLMSGAIVQLMGSLAIGAKASIISKLSVVQRLQPRRDRALTEARSHSRRDVVHGELQWPWQRRWQKEENTKEAAEAECVCSDDEKLGPIRSNNYIWWRERETG